MHIRPLGRKREKDKNRESGNGGLQNDRNMVSIVESRSVVICDRSGCCPDSRNSKYSDRISGTETKRSRAGGEERYSRNGNHGTDGGRDRAKRCAAVTGILELEREREQLRKEYDELRERYKNLQAAYEGRREDFEDLEKDYRALDESNNKLISEHEELKKENEAHWRQLTQIMRSNPEVFEQFSGEDESEQELIDNGYVVK